MSEVILRTSALSKRYKDGSALDNIDLTIERGHIYGLIGKEGSGKTALLRLISGLYYPSSGSIELFGVSDEHNLRIARQKVGFLIDEPAVFNNMSIRDNMIAQGLNIGRVNKKRINELCTLFGISHRRMGQQKLTHCTTAQQKRCGIAMALLNDPELLILDEPFKYVNSNSNMEVISILKQMNTDKGLTILITCIKPSDVYGFATDYILIDNGKILAQFDVESIDSDLNKNDNSESDINLYFNNVIANISSSQQERIG